MTKAISRVRSFVSTLRNLPAPLTDPNLRGRPHKSLFRLPSAEEKEALQWGRWALPHMKLTPVSDLRHLRCITSYVTSVMLSNHNPANTRVTVGMLESARASAEFLFESAGDVLEKLELHAVCGLPKMEALEAIDRLYDLGDELKQHAGRLCSPAIAARVALIHRSVLCSIPAKAWPRFARDPDIPLDAMLLPAQYISTSLGVLHLKDEIPPAFKEPVRVEVDGLKMVLACRQDQICGSIVFPWQKGENHFFLDHHLLCLEASLSEDMCLRGCRFPSAHGREPTTALYSNMTIPKRGRFRCH